MLHILGLRLLMNMTLAVIVLASVTRQKSKRHVYDSAVLIVSPTTSAAKQQRQTYDDVAGTASARWQLGA
jgi:hypothetical protein